MTTKSTFGRNCVVDVDVFALLFLHYSEILINNLRGSAGPRDRRTSTCTADPIQPESDSTARSIRLVA